MTDARTVACPMCSQQIRVRLVRPVANMLGEPPKTPPVFRFALHIRRDGSGQQCPGSGLRWEEI